MIIGVILRNFKTYKNINYIPLSNGESFSGFIGANGIGKSSILEALDCFFNNRIWNVNVNRTSSGEESCYIVPIFCIEKDVSIRPRACFSPSYNKVKSQTKHVWLLTLL